MNRPVTLDCVTTLDTAQAEQLGELFRGEWWCADRSAEQVRRLLAGPSLLYGLVEPQTRHLAAFARVVSDGVFKAWLCDVIVAPAWRNHGLGRMLLERVVTDPRLAGVAHLELCCLDTLVPFYRRFDFAEPATPLRLLRRERGGALTPPP